MTETVITDHRREKDLEELGIDASVKAMCGPGGRLLVEIDPQDFDRLTGEARFRERRVAW